MSEPATRYFDFGSFRLDADKRLLINDSGEPVPLMPKVFETILFLAKNPGRVIGKDELMSAIWPDTIVEENNLTQNISALRRALGEKPGEHRYIATVPGQGYKFVAEVRAMEGSNGDSAQPAVSILQPEPPSLPDTVPEPQPVSRFWFVTLASVCAVALLSLGFYMWRSSVSPQGDAPIRTLAVLPFKPLVAADKNEAMELGMADNLISRLNGTGDIGVRQLNAVLRYNSLEQDPVSAGRELGADAVLDGNIQVAGERVRISARLVRTADGRQLWSAQFDEAAGDIFAVQDSISQKVAEALKIRLGLQKRFTENVEAFRLFALGRYHWSRLTREDIEKAIGYFNQAIEIDPNYAMAYVGLAEAYHPMALTLELPSREPMIRAKAAAAKAIELDPGLAEGYAAMGLANFWYDWDWRAAEENFVRAAQLNANRSHWGYPHLLSNTGRHEEALREIKRSRELDPTNVLICSVEGQALFFAGRNEEALGRLRQCIDLNPNFWLARLFISRVYSEMGMNEDAVASADRAFELSSSSQANAYRAYALARAGRQDEVRQVLAEMMKSSESRYVPPYTLAETHIALGEREEAMEYLDKAFADKDVRMVFLKIDPMWDPLRAEARFIALMHRMNFE